MYNDFSTGLASKWLIFFGVVLFIVYGICTAIHFFIADQSEGFFALCSGFVNAGYNDIILAFAILSVGIGLLLWFFHRQFSKLAEIAEDIESLREEK